MSRRENITVLAVSLLASPITAILVNAWARPRYHHVGVLMAVAVGYLAYIGLYHLVLIVKKLQNR
jgi:4-hydroxybenzoate polyprenyltransferase